MNKDLKEHENIGKRMVRVDLLSPPSPALQFVTTWPKEKVQELVASLQNALIGALDRELGDAYWCPTVPERFLEARIVSDEFCLSVKSQEKRNEDVARKLQGEGILGDE